MFHFRKDKWNSNCLNRLAIANLLTCNPALIPMKAISIFPGHCMDIPHDCLVALASALTLFEPLSNIGQALLLDLCTFIYLFIIACWCLVLVLSSMNTQSANTICCSWQLTKLLKFHFFFFKKKGGRGEL